MHPLPDMVGTGAAVQIPNPVPATAVLLIVSGTGTVRLGDSTVTSSLGIPVVAGGGMLVPYRGRTKYYAAGDLWVWIPNTATVSPAYFD